jgi:hypothetical protein
MAKQCTSCVHPPLYPPLLPFTPTEQALVMMIPSAIAARATDLYSAKNSNLRSTTSLRRCRAYASRRLRGTYVGRVGPT